MPIEGGPIRPFVTEGAGVSGHCRPSHEHPFGGVLDPGGGRLPPIGPNALRITAVAFGLDNELNRTRDPRAASRRLSPCQGSSLMRASVLPPASDDQMYDWFL